MGKKCMVQSCGEYTIRHCLPKNEKQAFLWLQRSGNEDMPIAEKENAKICPKHFNEKCFLEYGQKKLKKGALPSLFLPNYTATGEAGDNFYFDIQASTGFHTPEKKAKYEMPFTSCEYSPVGKVITPRKTYSRTTSVFEKQQTATSATDLGVSFIQWDEQQPSTSRIDDPRSSVIRSAEAAKMAATTKETETSIQNWLRRASERKNVIKKL
ncbi:unnamed protein product [Phyllotreta striolata]|uniref:THAP-type domain-containing protein n=1 Tax=Phyllotreta striolata TaxID=444603 RepID=A0A9N9XL32_PHYSR|nr:unnamed protein product [Phyllotreta striolata]